MDLALFGFKLNLEVLILIGIVYLILVVNTLTSCCNVMGMAEGFAVGGVVGGTDNIVRGGAADSIALMNSVQNGVQRLFS
jgi:uncharacterized protein YebE (UPF0316 family)